MQAVTEGAADLGICHVRDQASTGAPLQTLPYRAGGTADWEASETGLAMSDLPFYFAQPEGAGAIDPLMVVAHAQRLRALEGAPPPQQDRRPPRQW